MIHRSGYHFKNREVLYNSIVKGILDEGYCLSTCPPDRDFLEWLKYEKGFSWQGAINIDIVETEDLGTVWRIMICSETPRDSFKHLE
jgi:hypothetical protein